MASHLRVVGSLNPTPWVLQQVRALTGNQGDLQLFEAPAGDPGWYGPDSVIWQVHAHFVAMMVGGVGSLILQALHPRALAAVWDHSNFREDLTGRLGRTAYFIAATTYGPRSLAQQVVDRVNRIHAAIQGQMPDGSSYRANEPDLIEWVHLGEVHCFLQAYQRLSLRPLGPLQANQYLRETARTGLALGARNLPQTQAELSQALLQRRGDLKWDERTRQTHEWIVSLPQQSPHPLLMTALVNEAIETLPDWVWSVSPRPKKRAMAPQLEALIIKGLGAWIQPLLETHGVVGVARRRMASGAMPD